MLLKSSQAAERTWKVGTLVYSRTGLAILFLWLLWGDFAWSLRDRSVGTVMEVVFKKFRASDLTTALLIGSLPAAIAAAPFTSPSKEPALSLAPPVKSRSQANLKSRAVTRVPLLNLASALLDRLTHHSQVLLFEGESYRFRESAGRLTKPRSKTN